MGQKFPAEHYTKEECLALLDACGTGRTGIRNKALIAVLWRSGLRLAEALALRWKDIHWDGQTIRVLHGKGDKARTVGMDEHEMEMLRDLQLRLQNEGIGPSSMVFTTAKGDPVDQSYIRAMLPRLARKAKVDRRIHAHGFRHTFAVELSRDGVPVRDIQQLLGHSSLATTSVYLASLSPEEALDRVRGREW